MNEKKEQAPVADNLITKNWESYYKVAYPAGTPDVQKAEMQKAFMAGAHSVIFEITKDITRNGERQEDGAATIGDVSNVVNSVIRELNAYGEALEAAARAKAAQLADMPAAGSC